MRVLILSMLLAIVVSAEDIYFDYGWNMVGSSTEITDMSVFNKGSVLVVYAYVNETSSWKAYSPNSNTMEQIRNSENYEPLTEIKANEGFWIKAFYGDFVTVNNNSCMPTVPTIK